MHTDSKLPDTDIDQRRYSYNEDVIWILNHLSEHGKILELRLSFSGRRSIHMSSRDKDFLVALKGVKADKLDIGNPRWNERDDVGFSKSMFRLSVHIFSLMSTLVLVRKC